MLKFLPLGVAGALLTEVPAVILSRLPRKELRSNFVLVLVLVTGAGGWPSRVASS